MKLRKKTIFGSLFLLWMMCMTVLFTPVQTVEAASYPTEVKNAWVTSGNYKVKIASGNLYFKKSSKTYRINKTIEKAYVQGSYIYYAANGGSGYTEFYVCNMSTVKTKRYYRQKNATCLGYYNKNFYFRVSYSNSTRRAFRRNISTGKTYTVSALNHAGGTAQYKNYMIVLGYRNDPKPTTLSIFKFSTNKLTKRVSNCSSARIIGSKIYFTLSTKVGSSSTNYTHKVYNCNITGSSTRQIAAFKGYYMPPALNKTYAYYYEKSGGSLKVRKYTYSTRSKKTSNTSAYRSLYNEMI